MHGASPLTLFPQRGTPRKAGGAKKLLAFRAPDYLHQYILGVEKRGYEKTEVLLEMLDLAKDAGEGLSDEEWFAVDSEARRMKTSRGNAMASLVKEAIEARAAKERKRG